VESGPFPCRNLVDADSGEVEPLRDVGGRYPAFVEPHYLLVAGFHLVCGQSGILLPFDQQWDTLLTGFYEVRFDLVDMQPCRFGAHSGEGGHQILSKKVDTKSCRTWTPPERSDAGTLRVS
jgi:hypothetical protein